MSFCRAWAANTLERDGLWPPTFPDRVDVAPKWELHDAFRCRILLEQEAETLVRCFDGKAMAVWNLEREVSRLKEQLAARGSRIDELEKSIGELIQQAGLEDVDASAKPAV